MNAGNEKEVRRLIEAILKRGYTITVHDGEDIALRRCTDPERIMENLDLTDDIDTLILRKGDKRYGWFELIYCNAEDGSEVISNYSANDVCDEIWRELNP